MQIFNASDRFTLPATPAQLKDIKRAVRALLDFHAADPIEEHGDTLTFSTATFMLSSRKKPLHRFSSGQITVTQLPDDQAEIAFNVRLSPMNIFGCVGAVIVGLMFAFVILNTPEISPWWALAAAGAGPVFAYSAKDQSVSRAKLALQEAAALVDRT
ncbi:MAG: hypothetical protein HKN05_15260 [Rhizobiales bacterium]|nr:hypothetical protein [Hyphomicrobiales bacterium]